MQAETERQILKERDVNIAFNMGLQTAAYVLEKAEELSVDGWRFLLDELSKQIKRSDRIAGL